MTAAFIAKWAVIVMLGLAALGSVLNLTAQPDRTVRRCITGIFFNAALVTLVLLFWPA